MVWAKFVAENTFRKFFAGKKEKVLGEVNELNYFFPVFSSCFFFFAAFFFANDGIIFLG